MKKLLKKKSKSKLKTLNFCCSFKDITESTYSRVKGRATVGGSLSSFSSQPYILHSQLTLFKWISWGCTDVKVHRCVLVLVHAELQKSKPES